MSKVTLRIIAEKCGISKYAVSRALAGKDGVSEANRKRIIEMADALGYQRQVPARSREIVAVFDDPKHVNAELHTQILGGLQQEAARLGYIIRAHWLHHSAPLDGIFEDALAGIAVNVSNRAAREVIQKAGIKVVYTGWLDPLEPADVVGGADHEAGAAVARHLVDLGHRDIVYVHGIGDLRGRRERFYGMREVIEPMPGIALHDLRWTEPGGYSDAFAQLLETGARPTGFFCAHDGLALNVVTEALTRGWRIPQDISVIGFGDFNAARQIRPSLSTVRTKGYEMGQSLLILLHHRLTDAHWPDASMRIHVLNELMIRSSCGRAPLAHPLDRGQG